jgi:hypothetical protein
MGDLYKYPIKNTKDGKVLVHLGFKSKILPRPLTDLNAWVSFCTTKKTSMVSNIRSDI